MFADFNRIKKLLMHYGFHKNQKWMVSGEKTRASLLSPERRGSTGGHDMAESQHRTRELLSELGTEPTTPSFHCVFRATVKLGSLNSQEKLTLPLPSLTRALLRPLQSSRRGRHPFCLPGIREGC